MGITNRLCVFPRSSLMLFFFFSLFFYFLFYIYIFTFVLFFVVTVLHGDEFIIAWNSALAWAVQQTHWHEHGHQGSIEVLCVWGLSSTMINSFVSNIRPQEVVINPLETTCECLFGGVINNGHTHCPLILSNCVIHLWIYSCIYDPLRAHLGNATTTNFIAWRHFSRVSRWAFCGSYCDEK